MLQLAAHLDAPDSARALFVLTTLRHGGSDRWELDRLRTLHELVQRALESDDLTGGDARNIVELRKAEASRLLDGAPAALRRLEQAPRAYVLRTGSEALARHARLLAPSSTPQPNVGVAEGPDGLAWVEVAWHDRPGLLAAITHALADNDLSVSDAVLATWPDGAVLDAFLVRAATLDPAALRLAIKDAVEHPLASSPLPDADLELDQQASPWHTVCEVRATDRPGLLATLATCFAAAGVDVRSAQVSMHDGMVIDRFEVTDRGGGKVSEEVEDRLRSLIRTGATIRRRRFGRRLAVKAP